MFLLINKGFIDLLIDWLIDYISVCTSSWFQEDWWRYEPQSNWYSLSWMDTHIHCCWSPRSLNKWFNELLETATLFVSNHRINCWRPIGSSSQQGRNRASKDVIEHILCLSYSTLQPFKSLIKNSELAYSYYVQLS